MTSVTAELPSARLYAKLNDEQCSHGNDHPGASDSASDILQRIGGRFTADLASILENSGTPVKTRTLPHQFDEYQQFALQRLQAGNTSGALEFIQRHAPQHLEWIERQLPKKKLRQVLKQPQIVVEKQCRTLLVDVELGRLARVVGQLTLFRAWAYAHNADNGDGWILREELESIWRDSEIAQSKRHARRLIQQGIEQGYWTQDSRTRRVYLTGQVKLAQRLVQTASELGKGVSLTTNKPGKHRMQVDLSGSLQAASANLYAAWFAAKDQKNNGVTISRETLCALWDVSIPTLLTWEETAGINKQSNYAQQKDTHASAVPSHAYLTMNRNGTHSAAWRLPNTYHAHAEQRQTTGKARKIRQAVTLEIERSKQRGSSGDAALPRLGRLYFEDEQPFRACSDYLRKLGRRGGDVFQRRYFYVGQRHGVRIYEPYNIQTNTPETTLTQRLIWRESNPYFTDARKAYRAVLKDHALYMEAADKNFMD